MSFSDANNPTYPSPHRISIPESTKDIKFTCNLPECVWIISSHNYTITTSSYNIQELTQESNGIISLFVMTSTVSYYTARVSIQVTPQLFLIKNISIIMSIAAVITLFSVTLILLCVTCICLCRKRNTTVLTNGGVDVEGDIIHAIVIQDEQIAVEETIKNSETISVRSVTIMPKTGPDQQEIENIVILNNNTTELHIAVQENTHTENGNDAEEVIYEDMSETGGVSPENTTYENRIMIEYPSYISVQDIPMIYQHYVDSENEENSLFLTEFRKLKQERPNGDDPRIPLLVEHTRVVLDGRRTYINASWIENCHFIATIHPTRETYRNFLQMIYQTEASMVVMLSTKEKLVDIINGKSENVCYWPTNDKSIKCDEFLATLIKFTLTDTFMEREISMRNTQVGKVHNFTHCIFTLWDEDSTLLELPSAVALLNRILLQKQDASDSPIIIHCQDGVCKTGIILTVLKSIEELKLRKSTSIFHSVNNLRGQRMSMVPTLVSVVCEYVRKFWEAMVLNWMLYFSISLQLY